MPPNELSDSVLKHLSWNRDTFLVICNDRTTPTFSFSNLFGCITMKSAALIVTSLAAVSAFAPAPAGRTSTQINESLFDKVRVFSFVRIITGGWMTLEDTVGMDIDLGGDP
jgi:hypothetical protein